MKMRVLPDKKILAYITTTFGYIIMHNVFSFYYVKIFLIHYHVSPFWFQISQLVFMVWNTVNDPLFGYCQDNMNIKIFKRRRLSILIGAPFYGLSFMTFWIPFSNYGINVEPWVVGIHLVSSLCLYDTLFTFVLLAHCCLFAEMEVDFQKRFNMKWWGVLAGLIGSIAVPIVNLFSDNLHCMSCFITACFFIGLIGSLCMVYTGLFANTVYDESNVCHNPVENTFNESIWKLTCQIIKERDFNGFVWLNFLHQGHATFLANFSLIFIDYISPGLNKNFLNIYLSILWMLPPLSILLFRKYIEQIGYYKIIKLICQLKIIFSSVVWLLGSTHFYLLFLLVDNFLAHSGSNFYDIALSDIADKDRIINKRKKPISSMIFATNAVVTKPAISLFPMFVVAILSAYGYQNKHAVVNTNALTTSKLVTSLDRTHEIIGEVAFNLACGIPFIVGILQYVSWSFYTIRESHQRSGPLLHPDFIKNEDIVI